MTALGLLLLVAIPLFFTIGMMVSQKIIQVHSRERLERETLQTISIPSQQVYWVKQGKEILVDGKLFDVKSFSQQADKIIFTGVFDGKENRLVKHIKELTEQKKGADSPFTQLAVKFLFSPVYCESDNFSIQNSWKISAMQFSAYTEQVLTGFYPADTPPPKSS